MAVGVQPAGTAAGDVQPSAVAQRAVALAVSQKGVPYVFGGVTPNGFDCSGLCMWAYEGAGKSIPRTSEEQWAAGYLHVPWGQWAPGDLVFSQWPGDQASPGHVVMYIGNGDTIAAPHTGKNVEVEPVDTFAPPHYVGSVRPAPLKGAQRMLAPAHPGQGSGSSSSGGGAAAGVLGGVGLVVGAAVLAGLVVVGIVLFRHRKAG